MTRTFFFFILLHFFPLHAQDEEVLRAEIETTSGIEKVALLLELDDLVVEEKDSFKILKEASGLSEVLLDKGRLTSKEDSILLADCFQRYFNIAMDRRRWILAEDALIYFERCSEDILSKASLRQRHKEEAPNKSGISKWIDKVDPINGIQEKMSGPIDKMKIDTQTKLARLHASQGRVEAANKHYQQAIRIADDLGEYTRRDSLQTELALLRANIQSTIGTEPIDSLQINEIYERSQRAVELDIEALNAGLAELEASADIEQAAIMKRYKALQTALAEKEQEQALLKMQQANILANRDKEIQLLEQEAQLQELVSLRQKAALDSAREARQRLMYGLAFLVLAAILPLILYRRVRRANAELDKSNSELAKTKGQIQALLSQQVSADVAAQLIAQSESQVTRRNVAVMFVDIRGFTPFTSTMSPEEIIQYQNDVFGFMIDVIIRHHGNINQFMGDGFMATFGAPSSHGNDASNAIKSALEITRELERRVKEELLPDTRVGIGLDYGEAVMGNIGNEQRSQFGITGHVVITAARIEQLNKELGSVLLVSDAIAQASEAQFEILDSKQILLKGQSNNQLIHRLK